MAAVTAGVFWIASYPKSGNTWVRSLIAGLLTGEGAAGLLGRIGDICPNAASRDWIETVLKRPAREMGRPAMLTHRLEAARHWAAAGPGPRLLKIHDSYEADLFPPALTAGTVLIVRDPRDIAPSWAHHMNAPLDTAIDRMNEADFTLGRTLFLPGPQAEQHLGQWSRHVASWLDQQSGPLLLLRYEALLADPWGETARLAAFLGLQTGADAIRRTVAACGFKALRAAEAQGGFGEKTAQMDRFFRQGRAGAWADDLSPAQAARIVSDQQAGMIRLGYDVAGETP